jgi:hypothetical protein
MRKLLWVTVLAAGCGPMEVGDVGSSVSRTEEGLTGCVGKASSSVPASGDYFLTTFGAGSDSGTMSCGDNTDHGSWYYAASRQRYGCGAHIQIEANGKCVIAQTDDYGPDVCVENAAGGPIIDASPLVAKVLFGGTSAGWSDHFRIHVTVVSKSTPLGPCTGGGGPMNDPPPAKDPASCYSSTLAKQMPTGTCVQSASDGNWYHCDNGSWDAGETGCKSTYPFCHSATLGRYVSERTCVQSASDHVWYQCGPSGWETPVSNGAGPMGGCSAEYSL